MNRLPLALTLLLLPLLGQAAEVADWTLPAPVGAAQPQLQPTPDGRLLLSWIERRAEGGHRMRLARFDRRAQSTKTLWGQMRTIAEGDRWFVNWADVPTVQALADGSVWAHTLEKSAASTYAYDVMLRRSGDAGASWSAPTRVHDDGTASEHGFVSMWPVGTDRLGIAWLDGRNTGGGDGGHDGHGGGMMSLRAAIFDKDLTKQSEWPLDISTCDCCQTDVATSDAGALLVYRDRTAAEVRDIYLTRFTGKSWTAPVRVHADNWVMPGCPVNGPAVAALGQQVWVAWPTGAGDAPSLRLARSTDAGGHFEAMQVVAGAESLGRVDLAVSADSLWVLWLQEQDNRQSLWLARYPHALGKPVLQQRIATLEGRGRATGIPHLQLLDGVAYVVWTDIRDGQPRLRGVTVTP